jgi:hypothetical protein
MGKTATEMLHGILWDKNILKEIKENIFHSTAESVLLYGGERQPWTENWSKTTRFNYLQCPEAQ